MPEPAPGADHRALGVEGSGQVVVGHDAGVDEHVAQPGARRVLPDGLEQPVVGACGVLEDGLAGVTVRAEELLGHLERIGSQRPDFSAGDYRSRRAARSLSPSSWTRSSMSSSSWRSSERRKSRVATSPTAIRSVASSRVR